MRRKLTQEKQNSLEDSARVLVKERRPQEPPPIPEREDINTPEVAAAIIESNHLLAETIKGIAAGAEPQAPIAHKIKTIRVDNIQRDSESRIDSVDLHVDYEE